MKAVLLDGQPIIPSKIICIGRNYKDHIKELNNEIPQDMVIFVKPNSSISSTIIAFDDEPLHYESEISFMVQNQQLSAVGFGLDLTKRELQSQLKNKGLPWERAKGFNGAAVFSPFVSIDNSLADFTLELRVNDRRVQKGSVSLMLNKPNDILAEVLSFMDLNDGDILMTGTPKGVGQIYSNNEFSGSISLTNIPLTQARWTAE